MSSAAGSTHRNRRPYPAPDTSKHYTEVPPRNIKQHSSFYKMMKRLDIEIAFSEMEPAEMVGVVTVVLLLLVLMIGGPIYLLLYAKW
ncbi:hypothetical protein N2W54_004838 [Lotmaria passim]